MTTYGHIFYHKIFHKILYLDEFGGLQTKFIKPRSVNFGVIGRTWDSLPTRNFVKIAQGDLSLRVKDFTKNSIFLRF